MSARLSLPRRLISLLDAASGTPGPVQVVVPCEAIETFTKVCRDMGLPLSPPSRTAQRDVGSGATAGYVTEQSELLPGARRLIVFTGLQQAGPDPIREARIRASLEEHWRTGVELPSHSVWPSGSRLPAGSRLLPGRALARARDLGLGEDVDGCLQGPDGEFPKILREPTAELLQSWQQLKGKTKITAVVAAPLPDRPILSTHLAIGIAALLGARYAGELTGNRPPSGDEDAASRVRRLASQLRLDPARVDVSQVAGQHVLLVGPRWNEGWTMTVSGQLLLSSGALSVRPFTLSADSRRAHRR